LLQEKIKDLEKLKYFKSNYITAVFKVDLYHLFIEKGLKLLSSNGILSFINPSNFQTNNYTETLRNLILTNYQLSNIVNFEDDVFDASVNTCVIIIKNQRPINNILSFNNANFINGKLEIKLISNQLQNNYLKNDSNVLQPIKNETSNLLIKKIENKGVPIKSIGKVNFGMQLRDRKVYIDDVIETKNKDILTKYHEPCYTGKNIKRYELNYSNLYCFFNVEAKRGGCWDRETHSKKNKIIIRQIGAVPIATLDVNGYALLNSAFMITSEILDTKYILALINSKSIEFYWRNKFSDNRKTFPKIKGTYLEKIPIANTSDEVKIKIINLIDQILNNKDNNNPSSLLEAKIDLMVYKLYELTYDEVLIIEPDFEMNAVDYDNFKL